MKTAAHIAEAVAWQRYLSSVQDDQRAVRPTSAVAPSSPATLALGVAWLRAYRERRLQHPVGVRR